MFRAKEKKERALGEHLHLKGFRCQSPKCALLRKPYRPGAHGRKRRPSASDFSRQLKEKQKFKISYGLGERNLFRLFQEAERKTGSVGAELLGLLERRLDNVLFRAGLAPSRSAAHQLIVHGHILINQKKVRSPGLLVSINDVIAVRPESKGKIIFKNLHESLEKYDLPSWLLLDKGKLEIKVLEIPQDINPPFEIKALVESFSK